MPDRPVKSVIENKPFVTAPTDTSVCDAARMLKEQRNEGAVLVIDNGIHGTIRMHQERRYPGRVIASQLSNPDFVLLFVPMDSLYALVLDHDPDILNRSYDNKVIIVSPTSLIAITKLIHHMWQKTYQSENAEKIAELGGTLLDKFILLHKDLENLGQSLNKNQEHYDSIINKLVNGRGNLLDKALELKKLGVKNNKEF